jgi:hypothetical protein
MAMTKPTPLPQQPHVPLVTLDVGSGMVAVPRPWIQWLASVDAIARLVATANVAAANDAAAATAGVPIGGFYQSAGAVHIRLV